jgi:hypothetical protein
MAAPERFAKRQIPLAPRAPSIHGPSRRFAAMQYVGRFWGHNGHRAVLEPETSVAIDPYVWSGRALQENFVELAVSGLASMYPAFGWSISSWPSWISARVRSH